MASARAALMETLPQDAILKRYVVAGGDEIGSGHFASEESSAALAANAFGFFLFRPNDLPRLPRWTGPWNPKSVRPEVEMRFPWRGGKHPWLDAAIETDDHLIGVESKRFEPFRRRSEPSKARFSRAYWRGVWGPRMAPYEWLRDGLSRNPDLFAYLDAVQLVKHAFGLVTQALNTPGKRHKMPVLAYVYAEPARCPPSVCRDFGAKDVAAHADEVRWFARLVDGAAVAFVAFSYKELFATFANSPSAAVQAHGRALAQRFDC